MLKDHLDATQYIQQYYYEPGMFYFYDAAKNDFEFKTDKDFRNEVLGKIDNCKIVCKK